MAKSIQELTKIIGKFADERDWKNNDPNQLLTALFIELSELAEHYQWKSEFEKYSEKKKREIGYEFVDVIFYLFQLARKSEIDIEKYFDEKLPKLAKKFPVGIGLNNKAWENVHKKYRKEGKNKLYN